MGLLFAGFATCFATIMIKTDGPGFMLIFILPFIAIGLGLSGWGILQIYSESRVGSPEATISNDSLRAGENFTFTCQQIFKSGTTVDYILIQLIMKEKATYRRGTNTHTVTHTIVADEFKHLGRSFYSGEIFYDDRTLQVPADAMHTFKARRNTIEWFVKLQIAIPRWPDIEHEYAVTVLPEKIKADPYG